MQEAIAELPGETEAHLLLPGPGADPALGAADSVAAAAPAYRPASDGGLADEVAATWTRLRPGRHRPAAVEGLDQSSRRAAYRLCGAGEGGEDVIAVRCGRRRAATERAVYERLLPRLALPTPRYYGTAAPSNAPGDAPGDTSGSVWLFVGEAAGHKFLARDPAHQGLAARWLADLHLGAARAADELGDLGLPDHGPGYYAAHLAAARRALHRRRHDDALRPALGADGSATLDALAVLCDVAAAHWGEVCRACGLAPRTIVHGDFAPRNLRVRGDGSAGTVLLAFDWEDAAWAPPALDLIGADPEATCDAASPDAEAYSRAVAAHWPGMDAEAVRRLGEIGRVFWHILAIRLDAEALSEDWLEKPLSNLRLYVAELAEAQAALGWVSK